MKEYDLQKLINNPEFVEQRIRDFLTEGIMSKQNIDKEEILGHVQKAENNLRFVVENIRLGFFDWSITGCYYASYHAALALIQTKGYSSKNHIATLCVLIKEFYNKELNETDIALLSKLLDYHDVLFYVESKNKREDATYSTKTLFDKKEANQLRVKAALFVDKVKEILKEQIY